MYPSGTLLLVLLTFMSATTLSSQDSAKPSDRATPEPVCEKPGWFGTRCQYQCHCAGGDAAACNGRTGKCHGSCAQGWFGPACQYVVYPLKDNSLLPLWLRDNKVSTCNPGQQKSIEVKLQTPQPFAFLRGVIQRPRSYTSEPSLTLTKADNVTAAPCQQHFYLDPDNYSFDLYCSTRDLVSTVRLSGDLVLSLCSLYISAGRAVAVFPTPHITTNQQLDKPDNKVSRPDDCRACSAPVWTPTDESLTVTFPTPVNVIRVDITCGGWTLLQSSEDFRLNFFHKRSITSVDQSSSLTEEGAYIAVPDPMLTSPVHKAELTNMSSAADLLTCTVKVLGDSACQTGQYGRQCEHTCNCAQKDEACHVATGFCVSGCQKPFIGLGCQHSAKTVRAKTFDNSGDSHTGWSSPPWSSLIGLALFLLTAGGTLTLIIIARRPSGPRRKTATHQSAALARFLQAQQIVATSEPRRAGHRTVDSPASLRSIQQFVATNLSTIPTSTCASMASSDVNLTLTDVSSSRDSRQESPYDHPTRVTFKLEPGAESAGRRKN